MVQTHLKHVPKLAPGVGALPAESSAFAATQAAWRFLNNERVTLAALAEPLREVGRRRLAADDAPFGLLVHDWCKLTYRQPKRKRDLVQLTHETDVGYELTCALLVSGRNGRPLAPMELHLQTGEGVFSTRSPAPRRVAHLEQVLPTMRAAASWKLDRPLVHVIDREADSVDHLRRWAADGHQYLIRGDDRRVRWNGESRLLSEIRLSEIRTRLRNAGQLRDVGPAQHQGRAARLFVTETDVVLDRPAKKNVQGRRFTKAGQPLTLRFLVVQVRDKPGQRVLAEWLLLSNVPASLADTARLARGYYWRWRIESFFKLLKSHGQELEQWQQRTGAAIARRLLVAAMACVVVWELQADDSPEAVELKQVLVRLSGRQTRRSRPHTSPALLAGLWVLNSMLSLTEHYSLTDLRRLAQSIPYLDSA